MKKTNPPNKPNDVNKIAELEDRLKRSLADYINLQNRIDREKDAFISLANVSIIAKLIDVIDDFELAQNHLRDPGLKMAIDKFKNTLYSFGLSQIEALNQDFDPQTMECQETVDGAENKVISVRKTGYLLNGQCLRPAVVSVGKKSEIKN